MYEKIVEINKIIVAIRKIRSYNNFKSYEIIVVNFLKLMYEKIVGRRDNGRGKN